MGTGPSPLRHDFRVINNTENPENKTERERRDPPQDKPDGPQNPDTGRQHHPPEHPQGDDPQGGSPADWRDHPITRALEQINGPGGVSEPVRIIAESIGPGTLPAPHPFSDPIAEASPYAEFWRVWVGHQDYLQKQSLRLMSGNRADAEDALSNAMVRAAQKFLYYSESIVNERAWLNRLVYNACIDHYRRNKRETNWDMSQETMPKSTSPLFNEERPTPEDVFDSQEQIRRLSDLLDRLSCKLRTPFLMKFVEGMSYAEIAGHLNIKNATVRKRIQLAREHIREAGFC